MLPCTVNLSETTVKKITREFLQQCRVESPKKRGRRSGCGEMENTENRSTPRVFENTQDTFQVKLKLRS